MTSTELIPLAPGLEELKRRSLIVQFPKAETMDLAEIADFNWSDCTIVQDFWENEKNITHFLDARKSVKRYLGKMLTPQQRVISVDIAASLAVTGDLPPKEAASIMASAWEIQEQIMSQESISIELVRNHLIFLEQIKVIDISPKEIKELLSQNGVSATPVEIGAIMEKLGYYLTVGNPNKIVWRKT